MPRVETTNLPLNWSHLSRGEVNLLCQMLIPKTTAVTRIWLFRQVCPRQETKARKEASAESYLKFSLKASCSQTSTLWPVTTLWRLMPKQGQQINLRHSIVRPMPREASCKKAWWHWHLNTSTYWWRSMWSTKHRCLRCPLQISRATNCSLTTWWAKLRRPLTLHSTWVISTSKTKQMALKRRSSSIICQRWTKSRTMPSED